MIALPVPYNCRASTRACIAVQIPGPPGPDCTPCHDGANGVSAFTTTLEEFTVPEVGASVEVTVETTAFMVPSTNYGLPGQVFGQVLVIQFGGYFLVNDVLDDTHVELINLGYDENAIPGAVIPVAAKVGIGGLKGSTGSTASSGVYVGAGPPPDLIHFSDIWIDGETSSQWYWNTLLEPPNWTQNIA